MSRESSGSTVGTRTSSSMLHNLAIKQHLLQLSGVSVPKHTSTGACLLHNLQTTTAAVVWASIQGLRTRTSGSLLHYLIKPTPTCRQKMGSDRPSPQKREPFTRVYTTDVLHTKKPSSYGNSKRRSRCLFSQNLLFPTISVRRTPELPLSLSIFTCRSYEHDTPQVCHVTRLKSATC